MRPICRDKAARTDDQGLLAMQKVEGSSPFSRFEEVPASERFVRLPAHSTSRAGRHFQRIHQHVEDGSSPRSVEVYRHNALDAPHATVNPVP
jgi:hypothetical protein